MNRRLVTSRPPRLRVPAFQVEFKKKDKGGVSLSTMVPGVTLTLDTCKSICAEYKVHNADIMVKDAAVTEDDLIDVIEGNRIYMPCVYALNKIDAITMEELDVLDAVPHYCPISSHYKWNLEGLLDMVFECAPPAPPPPPPPPPTPPSPTASSSHILLPPHCLLLPHPPPPPLPPASRHCLLLHGRHRDLGLRHRRARHRPPARPPPPPSPPP